MKTSIQYLAGLFDGEGWISISRSSPKWKNTRAKSFQYELKVGVAMCDYRPIKEFADFFDGNIRFQIYKNPKRKPLYHFTTSHRKAEKIIQQLIPYLICKKEQAQLALDFYQYCKDTRCTGVVGFSRKPVPDYIIENRHKYYLNLKKLKSEYPSYQL